jgi:hypothetical protein
MSTIKDNQPLCEILKQRDEKQPDLILFKKTVNDKGKTILNRTDNLLEATSAIYKYKDKQELIFEEK